MERPHCVAERKTAQNVFGLMLAFSPVLQMSVGVFVILLTGWWILALGIIRVVHAFHLLKIKRESDGFGFGAMIGCSVITAGINLIYLGSSPWFL